jgi:type II secretory pathway component PulC
LRQLLAAVFAALLASATLAQSSAPAKLYAVVFQVTVNSSGKVDALEVSKVLDPSSGTTNAVNVPVPESYVAAAREFLSKRTYSADPPQFFTYTFYDPSRPSKADIDPQVEHQ